MEKAGDHGTAQLWDARTMMPLGPPLGHLTAVHAVAFDSAGRRLVTADRDGGVCVWNLRPRTPNGP